MVPAGVVPAVFAGAGPARTGAFGVRAEAAADALAVGLTATVVGTPEATLGGSRALEVVVAASAPVDTGMVVVVVRAGVGRRAR